MTRTIIQISASNNQIVALCNDGTVWGSSNYGSTWYQIGPIPQPTPVTADAK